MSEDKRYERGARTWLEEGPTRAPERAISEALAIVETTPQERSLRVPWRLPVMSLPIRLAAVALLVALAAGGTYLVAGSLPDNAQLVTPQPALESPPPGTDATTNPDEPLLAYKRARNRICNTAMLQREPLEERFSATTNAAASVAERAAGLAALKEYVVLADGMVAELAALDAPDVIRDEHLVNVTQYRDMLLLIRQVIALAEDGRLLEAAAVDAATNPMGGEMSAWEDRNGLFPCP